MNMQYFENSNFFLDCGNFKELTFTAKREFEKIKMESLSCSKILGKSEKFVKANWRRKIKMIISEISRFFQKFNIPSFNDIYGSKSLFKSLKTEDREYLLSVKRSISNSFLSLIYCAIYNNFTPVEDILRLTITNKEGRFLTNIAKGKTKKYYMKHVFSIEDLYETKRCNNFTKNKRNIKFTQVPIKPLQQTSNHYFKFWEGFDYCEFLNLNKK